jgi:hypothetical protein
MLGAGYSFACAGLRTFSFSPGAPDAAAAILAADANTIFHTLLRDQESEGALYAAKQVLDARLGTAAAHRDGIADLIGASDPARVISDLAARGAGLRDRVLAAMGDAPR